MKKAEATLKALRADNRFITFLKERNHERKFNAFDVLGNASYEIRHSNIIAWLLRPQETHGIGNWFVKELFMTYGLKPFDVEQVIRESVFNIDIIVVNHKEKKLLAIENKTGSPEGDQQLRRYRQYLEREYGQKGFELQLVFLTPTGQQSSSDEENWKQVSYADMVSLLEKAINQIKSEYIRNFVSDYIDIINDQVLSKTNISELAIALCQEYGETLENLLANSSLLSDEELSAVTYLRILNEDLPKRLLQRVLLALKEYSSLKTSHSSIWIYVSDIALAELYQQTSINPGLVRAALSFDPDRLRINIYLQQFNKESKKSFDQVRKHLLSSPTISEYQVSRSEPPYYYFYERILNDLYLGNLDTAEKLAMATVNDFLTNDLPKFCQHLRSLHSA